MEAFSRTESFPKIVEAYSRPTRIIRGKEIDSAWEVLSLLHKHVSS
jgi:glycyl-tRNA synthetase